MSFTIRGDADRQSVADLIRTLKDGMRVDIKMAKRSDPQNAKFWAMLGEVAEQVVWHGEKLPADDWKYLFLDAYKREIRLIPAIEGKGFVAIGRSSSDLTVAEMADVITLVEMFGANHGVKFKDSNSPGGSPADHPVNTPAVNGAPHSKTAGVSHANSLGASVANDRASAPAADSVPQIAPAAGVSLSGEKSRLPADWFDVYVQVMTRSTNRAMSVLSRDEMALRQFGEAPTEWERDLQRRVATLVNRRDRGKLNADEFHTSISALRAEWAAKTKGAAA